METQIWSRSPDSVKALQGLDGVMFGGGPLDQGVGDALTAKGVKLRTAYGWCVPLKLVYTYQVL